MTGQRAQDTARCAEDGCDRPAAIRVHVPWDDDRDVCLPHGRALGQQRGVVAVPLDDTVWE